MTISSLFFKKNNYLQIKSESYRSSEDTCEKYGSTIRIKYFLMFILNHF